MAIERARAAEAAAAARAEAAAQEAAARAAEEEMQARRQAFEAAQRTAALKEAQEVEAVQALQTAMQGGDMRMLAAALDAFSPVLRNGSANSKADLAAVEAYYAQIKR